MTALRFALPPELEASTPPPRRDAVRLLVASAAAVRHVRFAEIGDLLAPGDLLVVNTSATLAAAVDGRREDGTAATVHFSTALSEDVWVVEERPAGRATGPVPDARAGERISLPDGVTVTLLAPNPPGRAAPRLWFAKVAVEGGVLGYLDRVGRPIRYAYVPSHTRWLPTRRSSRASPAAPRCPVPGGRSPRRSSPTSSRAGSPSRR